MTIYVTTLLPMKGYPLDDRTFRPLAGELVFTGVTKSIRKMTEYIGDAKKPEGFQEERVIVDIDTQPGQANGTKYMLEGMLQEPVACVEWEVVAASFEFHTD